jgi:phosphoserine aminotransferase
MLCVEDSIDAHLWAKNIGGLPALLGRTQANLVAVEAWVAKTPWIDFLAETAETRSNTSICLKIVDEWFTSQSDDAQQAVIKQLAGTLEKEAVGYDIAGYRDAPAGLRLWGGATVETSDLQALFPWIEYAYGQLKTQAMAA